FSGADYQLRIFADDLVHYDLDLAQMPRGSVRLLPHLARWNLNIQTMNIDSTDMHGLRKQSANGSSKVECPDCNERLFSSGRHYVVRRENPQTAALGRKPRCNRDLQVIELNLAAESCAQGLNHATLEDALCSFDQSGRNQYQQYCSDGGCPCYPSL